MERVRVYDTKKEKRVSMPYKDYDLMLTKFAILSTISFAIGFFVGMVL